MLTKTQFAFRSSDRVGFAAAEQDQAFLVSCFVDNGQYDYLVRGDLRNHIVLGRTGAGKTALLERIAERQTNIVRLDPEQLALNYLSTSTVIFFLSQLGLDLDLFFALLWRHVVVVEVLRRRFKINDPDTKAHFFGVFATLFQSPKHQKALEYLDEWGSSFWLDTEQRVKEVTSKLENDVRAEAGLHYPGLLSKIEAGATFSEEEKAQYRERFRTIVSQVQIQELANVIELLDAILEDPQNVYFVLVDHLDEKWVDDELKSRLIRALLETLRRFLAVGNLRIIIALRFDLYDRVLDETRSSQQQEEKLHSLCSNINWTREQLTTLMDLRISRVIKQRYTSRPVDHKDILPADMPNGSRRQDSMQWILDRTFMRPRDVIQFFNFAIAKAVNEPVISAQALLDAEGEYSRERLNGIVDEYIATYPTLHNFVEILYGLPGRIDLDHLDDLTLWEGVQTAIATSNGTVDKLIEMGNAFLAEKMPLDAFAREFFYVFYEVGIVGLQKARGEQISWTYESRRSLSRAEITPSTRAWVHPMLWRRLGTRSQQTLFDDRYTDSSTRVE